MKNKRTWTNNELEDLVRQLDIALEASGIGIWQHNINRNQTRWDEQLQAMYGVPKGLFDVVWLDSVHPDDRQEASAAFEQAISERSNYAAQFRIIRPDGSIRHLRSRATFFVDANDEPCFIGAEWDVTEDVLLTQQLAEEREAAERSRAEAKYAADHDYLTGLTNRRRFDAIFAKLQDPGAPSNMAMCHLDIDRFKEINDRFGHAGGDIVLRHVAGILSRAIKGDEVAARLGGDEFAILSVNPAEGRMEEIAEAIFEALKAPVFVNGRPLPLQCSIGIASSPLVDPHALLSHSDIALYEAKRKGRNRYETFSPKLAATLAQDKINLYDFREALAGGQITPYYQAQVDARTRTLCGLEALARWEHASGIKLPSDFLGIAANHGLIDQLDEAMLAKVLRDLQRWTDLTLDVPKISVNVSATRLIDPDLAEKLVAMRIPAGRISFELVETIFFDSLSDMATANIQFLRQQGIGIEIDDLGSGHASLLGLVELRPERVKIDRQLIAPILNSSTQRRLVGSLVDIARTLQMEVVAEGVETFAHADILTELGVDVLQGYAFGRPEPARVITRLFSAAVIE